MFIFRFYDDCYDNQRALRRPPEDYDSQPGATTSGELYDDSLSSTTWEVLFIYIFLWFLTTNYVCRYPLTCWRRIDNRQGPKTRRTTCFERRVLSDNKRRAAMTNGWWRQTMGGDDKHIQDGKVKGQKHIVWRVFDCWYVFFYHSHLFTITNEVF